MDTDGRRFAERDASPVSHAYFGKVMQEFAEAIPAVITEAVMAPMAKQIAALEARCAALEAKPTLKYLGVHTEGRHYTAGSCVTRAGGLWVAKCDTDDTPGDSRAWQLAVKRGQA